MIRPGLFAVFGLTLCLNFGLSSSSCPCDPSVPPCPDPGPGAQQVGNSSCVKTPRSDCPCCLVCAAQAGEACGPTNPCDLSKSLVCKDGLCLKEVVPCQYEGKIYQPEDTFYIQNCQTKCTCPTHGGQPLCQPTTCRPGLLIHGFLENDPFCEERQVDPEDECCVLVVCSSSPEDDDKKPEVRSSSTVPPAAASSSTSPITSTSASSSTTEKLLHHEPKSIKTELAVDNLEFLQISATSVQVQFPDITGGNLMYVEDRLYRGEGHSITPWENAIILEGNKIFTLTGLKPKTVYRLRWQSPDRQYPDVYVTTMAFDEKPPKVIITHKTFDSVTLSFDHFAPEDYRHGYVAMYRESADGGRWTSHEERDPTSEEDSFHGDLPSIVISHLKPNTEYMARIAIYKDYATRSLGKSTSIIEFKTNKGCTYKEKSYGIGQFFLGCESACNCQDDGEVNCGDRCKAPLRVRGQADENPLCVEQLVDEDKCCVLITCAGNADKDDPEGPCTGIKCGPNAECRHEVFRSDGAADTICVCKDGYLGDPDSKEGCNQHQLPKNAATARPKDGCVVKNETYAVDQTWFDGCEFKCTCSEKLEILCQPRCKVIPSTKNDKCELRTDPDDSCCKVMYCPDAKSASRLKPVDHPSEGCLHKNFSYKQGERFYDGCEQQCQCVGYGDIVCISRCPPTAPAPGQNCYTLKDASDPCCNITVCDKPVLDPDQNVAREETLKTKPLPKTSRIVTQGQKDDLDDILSNSSFVGSFLTHHHAVAGKLFVINESALFLQDFTYDGEGPDAFFWAGIEGDHPNADGYILPYPFLGTFFNTSDPHAPVLRAFQGEDLILHLPDNIRTDDLMWLSVWCRAFGINFGEVNWPKDQDTTNSPMPFAAATEIINDQVDIGDVAEVTEGDCQFKGQVYQLNQEFHDNCDSFCVCQASGQVKCNPIKCPSSFGLDIISPFCLEWDEHKTFHPSPPLCCPPVPVCLRDGTCLYKDHKFNNFDNIPANLTGCEKRCYCENGEVLCQDACYELSEKPPGYLACSPTIAIQVPNEERPCCLNWGCPELQDLPNKISSVEFNALNATSIEVRLRIPKALEGRSGYYKVFYTSGLQGHPDPDQWPSITIPPKQGIFNADDNEEVKLLLSELLPNQQYFLRVAIHVRDTKAENGAKMILSDIVSTRTAPVEATTHVEHLSVRHIDVNLTAEKIDSHSAFLLWRFFSADEKQFLDGVQIRFIALQDGSPASGVPGTTPFIHRDTNFFLLEDLKPDTEYRVDLYLIPVPDAETELISSSTLSFRTAEPVQDPYEFSIHLVVNNVGSHFVDLSWDGVPSPHQKFVNIYRILYLRDQSSSNDLEEESLFKVAKIDATRSSRIGNLLPSTKYQMWLEAYLRNGKVLQSNVLEVSTLDGNAFRGAPLTAADSKGSSETYYYRSFVAAVVIAVIAIAILIILVGLYLKRNTTYKAIISGGPSKANSNSENVYSNKAFKQSGDPLATSTPARASSSSSTTSSSSEAKSDVIEMNGLNGNSAKSPSTIESNP